MNEYMGDFIFDTFQPFYFHRTDEVSYYIPTANQEQAPVTGLPVKEASLGKYGEIICFSKIINQYSRSIQT
jgi:hypothetical protein